MISRRGLLQAASAPAVLRAQGAKGSKPNLLFVLSDDHSAPYLGCYGWPDLKTPHLDQFASEGMRFNRMFTTAPQCVPSRASLMTGRSAVAARMTRFSAPLPSDIPALPDSLRPAGYYTGVCRRLYHLDGSGKADTVNRQMYERLGLRTFRDRLDFVDLTGDRTKTGAVMSQFLDQAPAGRPFFFWVNFSDPHHVWDRNATANPPDPAKLKVPGFLPDLPGVRDDLSRYFDEIQRMDSEFGQVMNVLDQRGLRDNTLVIFMGDNGMAFPHGKGSLYDPGLNVPMLARWPGRIRPGAVTSELISGEDITPTFLDAAGLAPVKGMTGRSFLPLTTGGAYVPRAEIFAERGYHGNAAFTAETKASEFDLSRCVRNKKHKLIYNCTPQMEYQPVDSMRGPGWTEMTAAHNAGTLAPRFDKAYFGRPRQIMELYDLEADPNEFTNLAGTAGLADAQRALTLSLHEKMIIDQDYLPLPISE